MKKKYNEVKELPVYVQELPPKGMELFSEANGITLLKSVDGSIYYAKRNMLDNLELIKLTE